MKRKSSSRPLVASDRLYCWLLRAYPSGFRREYGAEMAQVFRDYCRTAYAGQGSWGIVRLWLPTFGDLAVTALKARMEESSMNTLSSRDLQQHVTILGWVYLLGHTFFLLIGGGVYVYTVLHTSSGGVSGEGEPVVILGLLTLLALPGMLAGSGLLQRKEWGRILALVVGFFALATWPVGTAIGLYTFWILLQASATDYFVPA